MGRNCAEAMQKLYIANVLNIWSLYTHSSVHACWHMNIFIQLHFIRVWSIMILYFLQYAYVRAKYRPYFELFKDKSYHTFTGIFIENILKNNDHVLTRFLFFPYLPWLQHPYATCYIGRASAAHPPLMVVRMAWQTVRTTYCITSHARCIDSWHEENSIMTKLSLILEFHKDHSPSS